MPSENGVKIDRAALQELLQSKEVADELVRRAEVVKAIAEATAPRRTGALASSHRIVIDKTGSKRGQSDRVRVRVVADVPYASTVAANTGYLAQALTQGGRD